MNSSLRMYPSFDVRIRLIVYMPASPEKGDVIVSSSSESTACHPSGTLKNASATSANSTL